MKIDKKALSLICIGIGLIIVSKIYRHSYDEKLIMTGREKFTSKLSTVDRKPKVQSYHLSPAFDIRYRIRLCLEGQKGSKIERSALPSKTIELTIEDEQVVIEDYKWYGYPYYEGNGCTDIGIFKTFAGKKNIVKISAENLPESIEALNPKIKVEPDIMDLTKGYAVRRDLFLGVIDITGAILTLVGIAKYLSNILGASIKK